MSDAFLSSDEYDERAHQLYNEGRYDDALTILKEGLSLYPDAVELHVGSGYAELAREEYAWARRAFDRALAREPDHEDALAGYGESLLRLGEREAAYAAFERILLLGLHDDHEMMLQLGRALFREGLLPQALRFFELTATAHPESPEAAACLGYTTHRLGQDADGFYWLRRALSLEPSFTEARVYLANALYDRGESEAALHHLEKTEPQDHFDELGIWRMIELRKAAFRLADDDPDLTRWYQRLAELVGDSDGLDELLAEVESQASNGAIRDPNQLELFGAMLSELHAMQRRPSLGDSHIIMTLAGHTLRGSWEEILDQFKDSELGWAGSSLTEFMNGLARRGRTETGVVIPVTDAEAFLRGSAAAGVLRIVQ
ncbi:MAG: tetratricopeptide repeat protein [Gemmatimonadota bacterium]